MFYEFHITYSEAVFEKNHLRETFRFSCIKVYGYEVKFVSNVPQGAHKEFKCSSGNVPMRI